MNYKTHSIPSWKQHNRDGVYWYATSFIYRYHLLGCLHMPWWAFISIKCELHRLKPWCLREIFARQWKTNGHKSLRCWWWQWQQQLICPYPLPCCSQVSMKHGPLQLVYSFAGSSWNWVGTKLAAADTVVHLIVVETGASRISVSLLKINSILRASEYICCCWKIYCGWEYCWGRKFMLLCCCMYCCGGGWTMLLKMGCWTGLLEFFSLSGSGTS